jgi:dTDP-4-dehydrorhamnose reductase
MTKSINKIYIAGSGGMLGDAFYKIFSKKFIVKCSDKKVNEKWIDKLDFTNFEKYESDVINFNSDLLIHLGAMTDLEECESNPEITYLNNLKSVEKGVSISKKLNIPFIFISTAGIFDGKKDIYDDDDLPNPLSHYGNSKYLAEKFIEKNTNNYLICRAGWMMGGGFKKDKKFVNKIINQLKSGKTYLNIVNDKNGTPTYTHDFANQVLLLIENNIKGKFNVVCEGLSSRLEVTFEILKFFNLEEKIKINQVNSDFFKNQYHAKRPVSERLINKKLDILSLNIMRNWKICLNEYLEKEYKNILK